jgi:hypothetical protein
VNRPTKPGRGVDAKVERDPRAAALAPATARLQASFPQPVPGARRRSPRDVGELDGRLPETTDRADHHLASILSEAMEAGAGGGDLVDARAGGGRLSRPRSQAATPAGNARRRTGCARRARMEVERAYRAERRSARRATATRSTCRSASEA